MRTDVSPRRGQAAVEFAIAFFIFVLILSALVGFAPVFLKNLALQNDVRAEAGRAALRAGDGSLGGASAAPLTRLAHPPSADATGDAWADPVSRMPHVPAFREWQNDDVTAIRLIPAGRRQAFRFRLFVDGMPRLDREGHLVEETAFPALGGLLGQGGAP